jgi:hypothetical protein
VNGQPAFPPTGEVEQLLDQLKLREAFAFQHSAYDTRSETADARKVARRGTRDFRTARLGLSAPLLCPMKNRTVVGAAAREWIAASGSTSLPEEGDPMEILRSEQVSARTRVCSKTALIAGGGHAAKVRNASTIGSHTQWRNLILRIPLAASPTWR